MLNNSGESGHPCLVPDIRGNAFSFSPLRIMFAVQFSSVQHCRLIIYGLYYVEVEFLLCPFFEEFSS